MLPVELMADAQVTQSSIRSPLVSISSCVSFLNNNFLLGGLERWVAVRHRAVALPDCHTLS